MVARAPCNLEGWERSVLRESSQIIFTRWYLWSWCWDAGSLGWRRYLEGLPPSWPIGETRMPRTGRVPKRGCYQGQYPYIGTWPKGAGNFAQFRRLQCSKIFRSLKWTRDVPIFNIQSAGDSIEAILWAGNKLVVHGRVMIMTSIISFWTQQALYLHRYPMTTLLACDGFPQEQRSRGTSIRIKSFMLCSRWWPLYLQWCGRERRYRDGRYRRAHLQ